MLTKQDLNAIGNLIDIKIENKFEEKLNPIRNEIKSIKNGVKKLQTSVVTLQKDILTVKSDSKKLRKDLKTTINFFDNRDLESRKSIDKTRSEIGLSEFNYA